MFARGLGFTRQIVFSATCSSRKAPVAATTNVMPPTTVAKMPGATLAGALEKAFHGERALAPDEVVELADNLAAHRLGTEHHAGNRSGHQQDRGDREQRVIGERRAEAGAIIVPPSPGRGSDQSQNHRLAHESAVWRTPAAGHVLTERQPPSVTRRITRSQFKPRIFLIR